ncbi:uncharacterized protein PHACADRAFT_207695 [Phanerochaete carnosa HHB-10118-sp]|uniref:DUF6533 domain-containing protein n=1 Tax=Phanerochaete carnosa (strain HHB-10118-sp) TaxID=650164 RepID=K5VY15_PHACS|nr:uncharacterized protein PHACADRAFT_207695 [Phanerochaete carnosa HHB-10118-sp]EKM56463.1 hypothetical protein PHACADRAFT_207695 [Phanerochaete carnosa HHB-10118-sp]
MDSDLIEAVKQIQAQSYADVAMTAIVVFEYLVTFDQELTCVWQRKFSATSVLLLTTRWVMIINQAIVWMPSTPKTKCSPLSISEKNRSPNSPADAHFIPSKRIALFAAFRVYALWYDWKYKHFLLAVVLTLGFVPVATNIFGWANIVLTYQGPLLDGCAAYINTSDELNMMCVTNGPILAALTLTAVSTERSAVLQLTRSSALACDIIVLIATWLRTFSQWREARQLHIHLPASTLLLRDGTIYFIALLAMNIAQMATFWDASINANIANVPLTSMPNVLVNRFLINLRQLSQPTDPSATLMTLDTSALTFAMPASEALGNIGESLEYGTADSAMVSEVD